MKMDYTPIGTLHYNWPMSAHASQAFQHVQCTDSVIMPFRPCLRILVAEFGCWPFTLYRWKISNFCILFFVPMGRRLPEQLVQLKQTYIITTVDSGSESFLGVGRRFQPDLPYGSHSQTQIQNSLWTL